LKKPLQLARAAIGFARVVREPDRLGEVFEFIDNLMIPQVTGPAIEAFRATEEGSRALRDRPRIGPVSLNELGALPEGTLGRAFADHLRSNGLDPSALPTREASSDEQYVSAHLYETHDVWHAVTGFGADRAGELGLQGFYLAQFPSRIAAGILTMGFVNTLLFEFDDRTARMDAITRGWVLGRRARSLLGVDWKALWAEPLADVRARYGVDVEVADGVLSLLHEPAKATSAKRVEPATAAPILA
jgi:ubiquinone biosynthesis protein Coq4